MISLADEHTWASRGVMAPKIRIGPKGYCRPKKRRQAKKSKYEFVLDLWIRIRIFTTNSVWVAFQIWIGPLIFSRYDELGGESTVPPCPCMVGKLLGISYLCPHNNITTIDKDPMSIFQKHFFLKRTFLGLILCGESIARIIKVWKRFLDPDSEKVVGVLKRKSKFLYFNEKIVDS